jgi:hypothetical protein
MSRKILLAFGLIEASSFQKMAFLLRAVFISTDTKHSSALSPDRFI